MAALFSLLAAPLFLVGLKHFKTSFRRAYIILCAGIGLFGLAQLQLPAVNFFNWQFWLDSGGAAAVYLFGSASMFWGVRSFARILGIRNNWTSIPSGLLVFFALALAAALSPHVAIDSKEVMYDALLAIVVWNIVMIGYAAMTTLYIKRAIGASYARSIVWLSAALFALTFAGLHFLITRLVLNTGDWYFDYSVAVIPFTIGALLFVKAGYEFNAIGRALEGDGKEVERPAELSPAATLGIVTYVAGLASNIKNIDVILDDFRTLTSRLNSDSVLTDSDKSRLAVIYVKLENYLVDDEPLRKFTREELRRDITRKFGPNPIIPAAPKQS